MGEGHTSGKKVSVYDAADVMGVTVDAIRKRIARGTIAHERDEDGRVWVILDTAQKVPDSDQDTVQYIESNALISQLRDEIAYLREENRRKDHLLAAALERIPPQLEAPADGAPGTRESPETASETGMREEPFTDEERPISRPWWRRLLGGD